MGGDYAELSKELKKLEPRTVFSAGENGGKTVDKKVLIATGSVAGVFFLFFTIWTPGWLRKKSGSKNFLTIFIVSIVTGLLVGAGVYYFM